MTIDELLRQNKESMEKAVATTYSPGSQTGLVYLPWQAACTVYGGVETPLLNRIGSDRALEITPKWDDVAIEAPAENAQVEGIAATALTASTVVPVKRTNTCQIVAALLSVTGSAAQLAANGVFNSNIRDQIDFQLSLKLPQMVASIAYSAWFGVEVTESSAAGSSARKMAGLIGTVGSYNDGILTSAHGAVVTDNSGKAFDQDVFDNWLYSIALNGGGANHRPTAVYCSLKAQQKISTFDNMVNVTANVTDVEALANLTAGQRVTKYIAPWGGVIDIIWEPQCAYSGTAANNWMAALCEPDLAMLNFRGDATEQGIQVERLAKVGDTDDRLLTWEGCLKVQVYAAHGILKNMTISV